MLGRFCFGRRSREVTGRRATTTANRASSWFMCALMESMFQSRVWAARVLRNRGSSFSSAAAMFLNLMADALSYRSLSSASFLDALMPAGVFG